jgi:hypothetical protein
MTEKKASNQQVNKSGNLHVETTEEKSNVTQLTLRHKASMNR